MFKDMTIHDFDMARFVTGSEVVEVYATGAVMVDEAIGDAGDLDTVVIALHREEPQPVAVTRSRRARHHEDPVAYPRDGREAYVMNEHDYLGVIEAAEAISFGWCEWR